MWDGMSKSLIRLQTLLEIKEFGGLKMENGGRIIFGVRLQHMALCIYQKINGKIIMLMIVINKKKGS